MAKGVPELPEVKPGGPPSRAEVIARTERTLEIEVESPGGFLVVTECFHPGWEAEVDGLTVPCYPTDHAFRGLAVPSGTHRVLFRYRPIYLRAGLGIGALGLALLLVLLIRPGVIRGREEDGKFGTRGKTA